jgi:hypothetical protein
MNGRDAMDAPDFADDEGRCRQEAVDADKAMTEEMHDPEDEFQRLWLELAESGATLSDQELLAEVRDAGDDPAAIVKLARAAASEVWICRVCDLENTTAPFGECDRCWLGICERCGMEEVTGGPDVNLCDVCRDEIGHDARWPP